MQLADIETQLGADQQSKLDSTASRRLVDNKPSWPRNEIHEANLKHRNGHQIELVTKHAKMTDNTEPLNNQKSVRSGELKVARPSTSVTPTTHDNAGY